MPAAPCIHRRGAPLAYVIVSIMIVAIMLLNSIPMEFVQRKSWEEADLSSPGNSGTISHGNLWRGGGAEVRIAEIMFDPSGEDKGAEWVMIYNNGTDDQDIDGWGISNSDGEVDALLPDWILPSASTLYVHFGIGKNEGDFEDFVGHCYTNNPYEIFNNSGDAVALFSGEASNVTIVDYMGWKLTGETDFTGGKAGVWASHAGAWTEGDLKIEVRFDEGVGLGRSRIDPAMDTSNDWETGRLLINEIVFKGHDNGDGSDLGNESVELVNPTDATVSTQGWLLKVDGGITYSLPTFDVPPKSFALIHFPSDTRTRSDEDMEDDMDMSDGVAELYFTWTEEILGDAGGALGLYSPGGMVDYVSWGSASSGSVSTDAVNAGIWTSGEFVSGSFTEGDSIGRDQFSTDTDRPEEWSIGGGPFANGPTPGTSNYYNIMIWDADLFADAGEEWIKISNFGTDLSLDGWTIYNRDGTAVATLPDITLPAGSSLTIHLGVGNDELDFGDWEGHWYSEGAEGQAPASKLFNASLDIVLITTGELEADSVVSLEIWLEDGFGARGTRGWWSDAWNAIKGAASWTASKVSQAVHGVVNGVLRCTKWLVRQINRLKSWILGMLNGAMTFNIDIGDYLSLSLTVEAMRWRFHAEANAELNIPVPGFPILQLHLAAQGTLDVVKGCGCISSSGQIVLTVGVNVGAKVKKVFTLELRAHLRLTITVGNLNIDDYCNPETHQGTVTVGLDIALDIVLGATFKLNRPEFTLLDRDWDWNLAQFTWSQTKQYQCCRDPKVKPGPQPEPYPTPEHEPSPPGSYPECGNYIYADAHVTNTDDVPHEYNYGAYTNTPGWHAGGMSGPSGPVASGSTASLYPSLSSEYTFPIPHTYEPSVGLGTGLGVAPVPSRGDDRGGQPLTGSEYYGYPGGATVLDFVIENTVDEIYLVDITVWVSAKENESLNSSITMFNPAEPVNITVEIENGWEHDLYNEVGYSIGDKQDVYTIGNFEGTRHFNVVIHVPDDAESGTVENVTLGTNSRLINNFTAAHMDNISLKIRVGEKVEHDIWSTELEDEGETAGWDNSTGEWQWGRREGGYAEHQHGPQSDEPGPHMWATNISGDTQQGLVSILETPAMDLSEYESLSLVITHWIYAWADMGIYVNSSGTWYNIKSYSSVSHSVWNEDVFDISLFLSDHVSFVFLFELQRGNYAGWHITSLALVSILPGSESWRDELENDTAAGLWDNSTGEWEWGLREDLGYGPEVDGPFPNMWGIDLDGTATEGVVSILESPVFNLSGYEVINLQFWHFINADGIVKLFVNDSEEWHMVGNWSGSREWYEWKQEYVDITDFLSDSVSFVFYFNAFIGQTMNIGWHINNLSLVKKATMDVGITGITPHLHEGTYTPGSHEITVNVKNTGDVSFVNLPVGVRGTYTGGSVVFSDNFETDKGWTITGGTWERNDELNFGSEGGHSMATIEPVRGGNTVHVLESPIIDLTGVREPELTFWENSWFEEDGAYRCELFLSSDGGNNWTSDPRWSDVKNSHGTWERAIVPLDNFISEQFGMRFVVTGFSKQFTPRMTLDEVRITGISPQVPAYYTDSIGSLSPGEEKNVTLTVELRETGPYELLFFVNCSADGNQVNNYEMRMVYIDRITMSGMDDLEDSTVTGTRRLEMECRDVNAALARFHYRQENKGNLTLIGKSYTPDSNMVWGADWDTAALENGNYTLIGEMIDIWGGSVSREVSLAIGHPEGTIRANFTHREVVGLAGTFVFSDNSEFDPAVIDVIAHYWDFGDGADSCLENPQHTYEEDGTYTFYHSVTASSGEVFAISAPIIIIGTQVLPELVINFSVTPDNNITKQTDVMFNDTTEIPTGLVVERRWDLGDGNTTDEGSFTHRYSHSGAYDINLTLYNSEGKLLGTKIMGIYVANLLPIVDFSISSLAVKVGEPINFTDRSVSEDGEISSWTWQFGDGTSATGKNVTHTYRMMGKYAVILNVTDEEGDYRTKIRNVIILREDHEDIQVIEVRQGEIRTLTYTDPSGSIISVTVSGDGTLVAAKIDDDAENEFGAPENVSRISFYLRLVFDGVLNWTNITISYADMPENGSLNYSLASIYYSDGIQWWEAENTGIDTENKIIWANVTHFTIFAAFAPPKGDATVDDDDDDDGTEGETTEESWYQSTGAIIAFVAILTIFVLLGVFLYVKTQKGDEEEEDEDMETLKEAEEIIKEIKDKDGDEERSEEEESKGKKKKDKPEVKVEEKEIEEVEVVEDKGDENAGPEETAEKAGESDVEAPDDDDDGGVPQPEETEEDDVDATPEDGDDVPPPEETGEDDVDATPEDEPENSDDFSLDLNDDDYDESISPLDDLGEVPSPDDIDNITLTVDAEADLPALPSAPEPEEDPDDFEAVPEPDLMEGEIQDIENDLAPVPHVLEPELDLMEDDDDIFTMDAWDGGDDILVLDTIDNEDELE